MRDDDQDVKRWLRGALADEPPLRLDRDEVFRGGRRKLRNRKLFQAGGAVTGVVAVVVGAMVITGLGTTDEPTLPPAASSSTAKPPKSPKSVTTEPLPPEPPSAVPQDELATRLTAVLDERGLLPVELEPLPGADDRPAFRKVHEDVYEFEADVRSGATEGWLSLLVEHPGSGKGAKPTCSVPGVPFDNCGVRVERGMYMTVAVQKLDGGEIRHWVRSVRPDGAFVTAISSNLSEHNRAKSPRPPFDEPPVTEKTLITLAAHPDLALG